MASDTSKEKNIKKYLLKLEDSDLPIYRVFITPFFIFLANFKTSNWLKKFVLG